MKMLQSNSRGADLAQGRHELRNDSEIESVFLPDSPRRYLYGLGRHQIPEGNMSGGKFFDWFADQSDAKAGRSSDKVLQMAKFDCQLRSAGLRLGHRVVRIRCINRAQKDPFMGHTFAITESNGERFKKSIGKVAQPGLLGSIK
jgi:hypothetical protein